MEGLAPPLKLVLEVVRAIENGDSVRSGVLEYLKIASSDDYSRLVAIWLSYKEQDKDTQPLMSEVSSSCRKILLEVLGQGLAGQSILSKLKELEQEIIQRCADELDEYVQLLPFKMLIPLLLFQFPAFLILLIGPLMAEFIKTLGAK
jgi:hypothetical protein